MSNDRVEELEATVSELESTVRGLTEELVETKERVRLLEAELEPSEGATTGTPATARRGAAADRSQADDQPASEEADPEDVQEAAAEADKGDGDNGEDETDGSELGDDIIVA